jgi:hypothetical protein
MPKVSVPPVPTPAQSAAAAQQEQMALEAAKGQQSTILTSGLGTPGQPKTGRLQSQLGRG